MTKPQAPNPDGLNKFGNGKGMKVVTKPIAKKRGASVDRTEVISLNRKKYFDTSSVPLSKVGEMVDPNKPLTEKAKLFVKFWAQGESISSAAARAGYGDGATYAYRLVRYPQAIALYNEEKRLYEEASQMTRKKVMDGLLEGIEMAKLISEPASMISGWREVGKMCGYYEPVKVRLTTQAGDALLDRMDRLSDAELLKLIQDGSMQALPAALNAISMGQDDVL